MPDQDKPSLKLSKEDDYNEKNFIERYGDSERTIFVVKQQKLVAQIPADVQFEEGVGWFAVDRRGHRWALVEQGDNIFALDLHDKTPREVTEEK